MSRPAGGARRGLPVAAAGVSAPADKRFRRSEVRVGGRRTRTRQLVRAAVFGVGGLLVLLLLVWAGSTFTNADMFRISRIVVRGNERLPAGQVRALLDGINGESLFRVDLEAYRARVLDSPWVADAVLWRVFPSTVEVRVTERVPLLRARLNGQLFLVDAAGIIMDSAGPQHAEFDLPIVDGLFKDAAKDATVDPPRIQLAARLLAEVVMEPELFRRVSQIDVSDPRNAVVLLDGEPARLRLGHEQFLERLHKYLEAASTAQEQGVVADYYDLRTPNVVVGTLKGLPGARDEVAAK